jgi:glycolate oxidase FAD binding subunit
MASERGWKIVPAGAGTWLRAGNPVRAADAVLSVCRLDRIVQYEPADLTLTAGAGLTLGALDRVVAKEGQWLPLDPPGDDEGTLGATLATGSSGGLSVAYGAARDLVLGVRLVTGDGRALRLGGRVVKNVAGFDMVKLAVGSWGTLGVITEASVRLFPRPQREIWLLARGRRLEDMVDAARRVASAQVMPAAVELLECPASTAPDAPREALLVTRIVGTAERAEREADLLEARMEAPDVERVEGEWSVGAAVSCDIRAIEEDAELTLRLSLPPVELTDLVVLARAAGRLGPGRDDVQSTPHGLAVDVLRGTLRLAVSRVRLDPPWSERWTERLRELRATLERRGGSLTVTSGPAEVVQGVGAWGNAGGAARLMAGLKGQFDPRGILSPGRWILEEG